MQGLLKKNEKKLVVRYFIFTFSKIKLLGDSESCDFKWLPTLFKSNYSVKWTIIQLFPDSESTINQLFPDSEPTIIQLFPDSEPTIIQLFPDSEPTIIQLFPDSESTIIQLFPDSEPTVIQLFPDSQPTIIQLFPDSESTIIQLFPDSEPTVIQLFPDSEPTSLCSQSLCCMFSGEAAHTNFIVCGLIRLKMESTIYRTLEEHANHRCASIDCKGYIQVCFYRL
jgi:hypothetical protein